MFDLSSGFLPRQQGASHTELRSKLAVQGQVCENGRSESSQICFWYPKTTPTNRLRCGSPGYLANVSPLDARKGLAPSITTRGTFRLPPWTPATRAWGGSLPTWTEPLDERFPVRLGPRPGLGCGLAQVLASMWRNKPKKEPHAWRDLRRARTNAAPSR